MKFIGSNPDLAITKSAVRSAINEWTVKGRQLNQNHVLGLLAQDRDL